MKRAIKIVGLTIGGLLTALTSATLVLQNRHFAAPYPQLRASTDSALIERGRNLALGAAHCGDCHSGPGSASADSGAPLSGGHEFHLPLGIVRVPNITTDRETGIGRYRDEEIARMLRYGVRPDGRVMLPFMPFANLSDEDLTAILSFLRSQAPVKHTVLPHEPSLFGRIGLAFAIRPQGPSEPVKKTVPAEPTAAYGAYLANSIANCVGCHTERDRRTGEFIGPRFGGGGILESHAEPSERFISPNLTPHPQRGWITDWSEDAFVARLQSGPVYAHSPMPWSSFRRMSETDLRAIYRYLRTLPPAETGPDPKARESVRMKSDSPRAERPDDRKHSHEQARL
ncbi:MAG TPA: cytochrome c [Polyangiaceae bacterium]|nr:cytochrome c [Polyangiaceae bacterium]